MQKVYLLLRSNKQTGPYTLEELLQLNLKPFDLVWVEGRSAAWQYPSEISTLKPFVTETPQATVPYQPVETKALDETLSSSGHASPESQQLPRPEDDQKPEVSKRIFVSVPKSNPARQAPPAAQPKEAVTSTSYSIPYRSAEQKDNATSTPHTNYSRSLDDVEADYTNWVYRAKTKKKSLFRSRDVAITGLILLVIAGGYYLVSKPSVANSVLPVHKATTTISNHRPANSDSTSMQTMSSAEIDADISGSAVIHKKTTPGVSPTPERPVQIKAEQVKEDIESMDPAPVNQDVSDMSGPVTRENKNTPRAENAPAQKKKLGAVIKSIFTKKEKEPVAQDNQVVLEEPRPAENRQATRRGNEEGAAPEKREEEDMSTLMSQIDISSNAPGNWMMGIKNLKVTLRNRSNINLQTASVQVSYFNENDEILEKKLVYFSNVAAKGKATIGAPDNKWADHVELKLVTVSSKDDRFAGN